ncbi:MAG: hypothetical protein LUB63_04455, partial [Oscillospiraceae bacterium]|nr:hypothetical protein [Oscillospiraceae bacterium]
MDVEDVQGVSFGELTEGYKSQWELMNDLFAWLDLRLYIFYKHHQWLGPKNEMRNMLGLVVSREEFEHNLTKAAQQGLYAMMDPDDAAQIQAAEGVLTARLERTRKEFPLLHLFERCGLDRFQRGCVALAYGAALDQKYEKLLAYLQDDITRKSPSVSLAVQLFVPPLHTVEEYRARFSGRDRFTELFDGEKLAGGELVLRQTVLSFLSTDTVPPSPGVCLFDGAEQKPDGPLVIGHELARQLDAVAGEPGPWIVCLHGSAGSGKRFQIKHLMSRQGKRCVFADLDTNDQEERMRKAALAARLADASLCCYHLDKTDEEGKIIPLPDKLLQMILGLDIKENGLFLLSQLPVRNQMDRLTVDLEVPATTENERILLFQAFLGDDQLEEGLTAGELASKFRFSPRQIRLACEQASGLARLDGAAVISSRLMHRCCYRQVVHKLGDLASPVRPAFTWDDGVMPEDQKTLLQPAGSHL